MNGLSGKRKNHRKYPGVRGVRPDLKKIRQEESQERLKGWQSLSYQDQLSALDRRLGKDMGAKKQRTRLNALIVSGETQVKLKKKK